MHHNPEHRSCDKDAQGIVDSMGVAFYEPLYDFHGSARPPFANPGQRR
jgi:hypothetical protein